MTFDNVDVSRFPEKLDAVTRYGARVFLRSVALVFQLINFAVYPFSAEFNGVVYKPKWS